MMGRILSRRQMPIREQRRSRDGTLVVCVMVCLLVASTIVTATTQMALRSRREVRREQQMRQTELLLDAGILRASNKLRASADYQGEVWRPTGAITRFVGANVDIRVSLDPQQNDSRQIEVIASLGTAVADAQQNTASLTRRSHRFELKTQDSDSQNSDSSTTDFSSLE